MPGALLAILIGSAACSPQHDTHPTPPPEPSFLVPPIIEREIPSCTIDAKVAGRQVSFSLDLFGGETGAYTFGTAVYTYGDHTTSPEVNAHAPYPHTYMQPGSYRVDADVTVNFPPDADPPSPIKSGYRLDCSPTTIGIPS